LARSVEDLKSFERRFVATYVGRTLVVRRAKGLWAVRDDSGYPNHGSLIPKGDEVVVLGWAPYPNRAVSIRWQGKRWISHVSILLLAVDTPLRKAYLRMDSDLSNEPEESFESIQEAESRWERINRAAKALMGKQLMVRNQIRLPLGRGGDIVGRGVLLPGDEIEVLGPSQEFGDYLSIHVRVPPAGERTHLFAYNLVRDTRNPFSKLADFVESEPEEPLESVQEDFEGPSSLSKMGYLELRNLFLEKYRKKWLEVRPGGSLYAGLARYMDTKAEGQDLSGGESVYLLGPIDEFEEFRGQGWNWYDNATAVVKLRSPSGKLRPRNYLVHTSDLIVETLNVFRPAYELALRADRPYTYSHGIREPELPLESVSFRSLLAEAGKFEPGELEFREECRGFHHEQTDCTLRAFDPVYELNLGYIDYVIFRGEIHIEMIEVYPSYQRQGVATAMWRELQRLHPGKRIHRGYSTPSGAGFLGSLGEARRARA